MKKFLIFILCYFCIGFVYGGNFNFFFKERIRYTSINNGITLNDKTDPNLEFSRVKSSVGISWKAGENIFINSVITNEFRYYLSPSNKDFSLDEVFFEQLFLKINKNNFVVTLGRQNIMLGEGLIMFDGSPLDGSRSAYFNGLKVDYNLSKTKLSFFSVTQTTVDDYLPVLNSQNQQLTEFKEKAYGVYSTYNGKNSLLDMYFLNKKTNEINNNINTIGFRYKVNYNKKIVFTVEYAFQKGDFGIKKQDAFGGYAYVDYNFKSNQTITVGSIFLSGDDTKTTNVNEGWDSPFGRWPKWSELLIYTQIVENNGKVAYWSNLNAYYGQYKTKFAKSYFKLAFYKLFADENSNATDFLSGKSKDRGSLLTLRYKYNFNEHINFSIVYEHFSPGDYYFEESNNASFFRIETSLKY